MPSLEENLARYEQLIPHLHNTQTALWRRVDEGMMRAACGVIKTATGCDFLPKDDDSIATMLNYCCFNVFLPGHRTLVDVYVATRTAESDDERAVLHAHQRSFFSLFELLEVVPRIGARLRELFTDEIIVVVYPRLAETMRPGLVLPVRVLPLEEFHVLFNGPVPFHKVASVQQYEETLFKNYGEHGVQKGRALNEEQRGNIETFEMIKTLSLRSPELVSSLRSKASTAPPSSASPLGKGPHSALMSVRRNDPCPCGSGKKFKQCCLRRN
jgi:SEC-C motif-containing protein